MLSWRLAFVQAKNRFPASRNTNLENDVLLQCLQPPYDTQPGAAIDCGEFYVCMPRSFGGDKNESTHASPEKLHFIVWIFCDTILLDSASIQLNLVFFAFFDLIAVSPLS